MRRSIFHIHLKHLGYCLCLFLG